MDRLGVSFEDTVFQGHRTKCVKIRFSIIMDRRTDSEAIFNFFAKDRAVLSGSDGASVL